MPTEHTDSPFTSGHLTAAADTSFSGRSYRARSTDWVDGAAGTSRDSATDLPSLHSSGFAPVPEPAIRTGVTALTSAVLNLMNTP